MLWQKTKQNNFFSCFADSSNTHGKRYKACRCKCRHTQENQEHQNSSNEVEDLSFFSGLDYIWPKKISPNNISPMAGRCTDTLKICIRMLNIVHIIELQKFPVGCLTACTLHSCKICNWVLTACASSSCKISSNYVWNTC